MGGEVGLEGEVSMALEWVRSREEVVASSGMTTRQWYVATQVGYYGVAAGETQRLKVGMKKSEVPNTKSQLATCQFGGWHSADVMTCLRVRCGG